MKLNYCKSGILILKGRLRNIRELKKKDNFINKVNVGCLINNNSNDNCSNYDAEGFDKSDGNDTNTTNSNISLLYKNIPIVDNYKYVELNNKLNPLNHLKNVNIKLLTYLKRNKLLIKSYFSLNCIKMLHKQFQESRLLYGMSVFMDIPLVIKLLNKIKKKYFVNIYNLMVTVNYNKLLLTLHCSPIEYVLFPRLVEIIKKYTRHFNEKPRLYDDLIRAFDKRIDDFDYLKKQELVDVCFNQGMIQLARFTNIEMNENFLRLRALYFVFPDKRDIILVKFLLNVGVFAYFGNRVCVFCSRKVLKYHYCVDCSDKRIKDWRDESNLELDEVIDEDEKDVIREKNLEEKIKWIFFNPPESIRKASDRILKLKTIVLKLNYMLCKNYSLGMQIKSIDE